MKQRIQIAVFSYGCIAFLVAALWFVLELSGKGVGGVSAAAGATLAAIHGSALVLTFYRDPLKKLWQPVLAVTLERLKVSRIALLLTLGNSLFLLFLAARSQDSVDVSGTERTAGLALLSIAALSSLYIALHWAFRPENLFPEWLVQTAINPYRWFFAHNRHPEKRRQAED